MTKGKQNTTDEKAALGKAIAVLNENETRYKQTLSLAKVGGWEYDLASGHFLFNDNFYEIFRSSAKVVGGYNMTAEEYAQRFVHPDDREVVAEEIEKSIRAADPDFTNYLEHRIVFEDGEIGHIGVRYFAVKDKKGRTIKLYGVNQDITDRKQAEIEVVKAKERAEESEEKLLHAQKLSHVGSWEYITETDTVIWSRELFNIYERPYDLGAPPYSKQRPFYTKESFDRLDKAVINCITHHIPYELELDIITHSGAIRQIISKGDVKKDRQGRIIGCHGTAQDITERKKLESDLIEAKHEAEINTARYRSLLTNLETGVVVHAADTSIISCNASSCVLLGLTEDQMRGKVAIDPYWKFVYEDGTPLPLEDYPVMRVLNTKTAQRNQVVGVQRSENEVIWVLVNGFPTLNEKGEIKEVTISFIDITIRKLATEELKIAKERAEESDRLKTAFLQNLSHEIRTPLNAICGFAQMLGNPGLSEEKKKSNIALIQSSSEQLLGIISDVLAVSSLETGQEKVNRKQTNVNEILMEFLAVFNTSAVAKNITLSLNKPLPDSDVVIDTDETKFRQIMTNLLTNAFKFTSRGSVTFGYQPREGFLEFYVKDTGIGIHSDHHEKIFERFSQADATIKQLYGGTGLGLCISKSYVQLLGGSIWLESEPENGTTFYFTIPHQPVTLDNTEKQKDQRKVLVAEDQLINFMVIEGLLEEVPVQLLHAQNGQEAIDLYKNHPDIELILMDIKMPVMQGDEAARVIKSLNPDVTIIAQSGYALEQEREKYMDVFDDYMTKPINVKVLLKKVISYVEGDLTSMTS